jgi:hypothetical protein
MPIDRNQAFEALAQVRARQRAVIAASVVPDGYWAAIAAVSTLYAAAIESHVPVLQAIGGVVFAVGMTGSVLWAVFHSGVRQRRGLLTGADVVSIFLFVLSVAAIGAAVAIALTSADVRFAATIGIGTAGAVMAVTGPILNRRLRGVMLRRAAR